MRHDVGKRMKPRYQRHWQSKYRSGGGQPFADGWASLGRCGSELALGIAAPRRRPSRESEPEKPPFARDRSWPTSVLQRSPPGGCRVAETQAFKSVNRVRGNNFLKSRSKLTRCSA
jgi:hypothetical protein